MCVCVCEEREREWEREIISLRGGMASWLYGGLDLSEFYI